MASGDDGAMSDEDKDAQTLWYEIYFRTFSYWQDNADHENDHGKALVAANIAKRHHEETWSEPWKSN